VHRYGNGIATAQIILFHCGVDVIVDLEIRFSAHQEALG
jgi:hypothetical protein